MTFSEHMAVVDGYRSCCDHQKGNVSFNHKQLYNNKPVRSRVACLMLYPIFDDSHYDALKIINEQGWAYVCIQHDHDRVDPSQLNAVSDIASKGDSEEVPPTSSDIPEDAVDFDPENIFDAGTNLKKIHDHVVMYFENARTNTAVAKLLGINSVYVKMFRDSDLKRRIGYLTHIDDLDKYQYNPNNLFGPLACRYSQVYREHLKRPSDLLQEIILDIKNTEKDQYIRSTDFFMKLIRNGYDMVLLKYRPIIRDAIVEHNFYANFLKQEGIREIDIDRYTPDYNPDGYIGRIDYK